jgi:hypothetical protein
MYLELSGPQFPAVMLFLNMVCLTVALAFVDAVGASVVEMKVVVI